MKLHVFTARANPLRYRVPHENYLRFAEHMLLSQHVHLTVIECAYGDEPFSCELPGVRHIGVRAKTRGWCKENLLNLGVWQSPEAEYIAWIDSDIIFRNHDWASETLHALQHYDVVQPWSHCYDLGPGPGGSHIATHTSFAHQYFFRQPLVPPGGYSGPYWQGDGGPYVYPHSGYAWAMTRQAYSWVGGLFELGGMGSGDHHMALALAGLADYSMPIGTHNTYREAVKLWEERAGATIHGNLGYVPGTIEHLFHGKKTDRGYLSRWSMFLQHQFDPIRDLKRNAFGVFEFASNKPELRHDFDLYLHSRNEDCNVAF